MSWLYEWLLRILAPDLADMLAEWLVHRGFNVSRRWTPGRPVHVAVWKPRQR